mmetsp:Transcript_8404/g.25482  ORF Transcript_8404/g.25482 Transcript_8404/m.25482 type:complete len:247 (+) Transcript_8404:552-1292(+)
MIIRNQSVWVPLLQRRLVRSAREGTQRNAAPHGILEICHLAVRSALDNKEAGQICRISRRQQEHCEGPGDGEKSPRARRRSETGTTREGTDREEEPLAQSLGRGVLLDVLARPLYDCVHRRDDQEGREQGDPGPDAERPHEAEHDGQQGRVIDTYVGNQDRIVGQEREPKEHATDPPVWSYRHATQKNVILPDNGKHLVRETHVDVQRAGVVHDVGLPSEARLARHLVHDLDEVSAGDHAATVLCH